MYWSILDDYTVRRYSPKGKKAILIRILEPRYKRQGEPYNIYTINEYSNVLKLYFDDITKIPNEKHKNRFVSFGEKDCMELISFIKNNHFDEIVVHCNAGISRSSAIMICISKLLNLKEIEDEIYSSRRFNPNKLILKIYDNLNIAPITFNCNKIINVNKSIWNDEECDVII